MRNFILGLTIGLSLAAAISFGGSYYNPDTGERLYGSPDYGYQNPDTGDWQFRGDARGSYDWQRAYEDDPC